MHNKSTIKMSIPPFSKQQYLVIGGILLLALVIWLKTLNNSFVYWDDDRNFTENKLVNSKTNNTLVADLVDIFKIKNHVIGNYNPLSTASFRIENAIFGMEESSWKYWHLNNVLLHLLCIFLVFRLGVLLKLNTWGAALLAILFAIHPLRVESVAWLTERKDVLFASFYFGALIMYTKNKYTYKFSREVWIVLLFILSGLSKIQAVSLPLSFIAIDFLLDKKWNWKNLWSKHIYFLISLIIGIIGIYALSLEGSLGSTGINFTTFERMFVGAFSLLVYLTKSLIPYRLVPMYPYPSALNWMFYASSLPALGFIGVLIYTFLKGKRIWFFGLSFFFFNIVFLLQIVGAGQGFIADRFTYVAYFGLFFIMAYFAQQLKWKTILGKAIWGAIVLYVLIMTFLTYKQIDVWKNSYSLWTHVINYYPNTKIPWGNRANYLRDVGRLDEALSDYNKRLSLSQDDPKPFNSRGKLFFNSTNQDTLLLAYQDYSKAIELDSSNTEYFVNRGSTLAKLGQMAAAIQDYSKAIELAPNNANAYYNRSIVNHLSKNYIGELEDLNVYLKLMPRNGVMYGNRGIVKRLLGKPAEAIDDLNIAIKYTNRINLVLERAYCYLELNQIQALKQDLRILQQNKVSIPADLRPYLN